MRRYIIIALAAIPVVLVLFVGAGYAHDEVLSPDSVSRGVTVANIDVSRLPISVVEATVVSYEDALVSQPVELIIDGNTVYLDPADVDLTVDESAVASAAMQVRRADRLVDNVQNWLTTWTSTKDVDIPTEFNEESLAVLLDEWSRSTIGKPAYEGTVRVVNGLAVPEYPQPGLTIDIEATTPLIAAQLSTLDREPVEVPLMPLVPQVTDGDVDVAVTEANLLIGDRVILRAAGKPQRMVFTPAGLASALRAEVITAAPATVEVHLDIETLTKIAVESADEFVIAPVSATFTFDDEAKEINIVPSVEGEKVDIAAVPDIVIAAAMGNGSAILPMTGGATAELTTEMAEEMGPFGEVSTFTTTHPCCANRVTNIQLLADAIKGSWVFPGETFSVNDTAGQRTLAKGYKRAGAIINGRVECCDSSVNIGGGTSQFATTIYNAVFFGCYEDVFHQPHSLYFSRYPYVREATLGFPAPDVKFRNDSDAIVYVDTTHTGGSITVTLYGNNGGRTCTSERSGNTITRVMKWPDGKVTTQKWTWNYKQPRKDEPEPTTTTTTTKPTTTTTAPATTTTTAPATTTTTTAPVTTTSTPTTTAAP